MNETQKEIMDMVKEGVKNEDSNLLEDALYKSILEKENTILNNILEKTPMDESYLSFNQDIYIQALNCAVEASNSEAIAILPNVLTQEHYYVCGDTDVIKNNDADTLYKLLNLDNFSFDYCLHTEAIRYDSQDVIKELLEVEDYEPYVLGEALESNNIETISRYYLHNHEWFLDRMEESDEQAQEFIEIHDKLLNSKEFKDIAKENGLDIKEVEKYTVDFLKENFPEEYKPFEDKKRIKENALNF